ncbi:MAG: hypothetical protein L3I91_01420 [Mycoplasma sp.]
MVIIYGLSKPNIKNALTLELLNKQVTNSFVYDDNFETIIGEVQQNSLFDDPSVKKLYVIEDASFLTKKDQKSLSQVEELLNSNHQIILTVSARNKTSFAEVLQKNKNITWIKAAAVSEENKKDIIENLIKHYQIGFDKEATKEYLIAELSNNWNWVNNELTKIALVNKDEVITKKVLDELLFSNYDENILSLSKLILQKQTKQALDLFEQLIKQKVSEVNIINILVVSFFEFKLQKQFFNMTPYNSIKYRCMEYGWYPSFIYENYKVLEKVNLKTIDQILTNLLDLDYKIKTNQLIPSLALKLFILNNY